MTVNACASLVDELVVSFTRIDTATIFGQSVVIRALVTGVEAIAVIAVVSALVAPSTTSKVSIRTLVFASSVLPVVLPVAVTVRLWFTAWVLVETTSFPSGITFQTPFVLEGWIGIGRAGLGTSKDIIFEICPVSSLAFSASTFLVGFFAAFVNLCLVVSTAYWLAPAILIL